MMFGWYGSLRGCAKRVERCVSGGEGSERGEMLY